MPVPVVGPLPDVSGYLEQLQGSRSPDSSTLFARPKWIRRFFVLCADARGWSRPGFQPLLLIYKTESDAMSLSESPLEAIPCQGATASEYITSNINQGHANSTFAFSRGNGQVTYLRAGSHDARQAWLEAISGAIAKAALVDESFTGGADADIQRSDCDSLLRLREPVPSSRRSRESRATSDGRLQHVDEYKPLPSGQRRLSHP